MKKAIKLARQKLDAKKQKLDVEPKSFIYDGKLYDIQSFEEFRSSPGGRRVRGKRKFEPATPGSCGLDTQPRRLRPGRDTSEGVLPGDASTDIGGGLTPPCTVPECRTPAPCHCLLCGVAFCVHHIRRTDDGWICIFCLNDVMTSSLRAHTVRSERPGWRLAIRYRDDVDGRERTALAIVADPAEWLVASSTRTYKLVGAAMIVEVAASELEERSDARDAHPRKGEGKGHQE